MVKRDFAPVHPGEILKHEFMEPYRLSARKVAALIGIGHHNRITELINGKRSITSDTAIRLERLFGFSAQAWLNLQQRFDLETARISAEKDKSILGIRRLKDIKA